MKFIYKNKISGQEIEVSDREPKDTFDNLRFNGYVQVKAIPETVEDEYILEGHPYPGHECWDD